MKTTSLAQLLLGATTITSILPAPSTLAENKDADSSIPTLDISGPIEGTLNATAWTLIYTYPLYIFANWAGNVLRTVPVNTILHQRYLASPSSPGVIKPNVDTLYSRVVLDLSQNDVVTRAFPVPSDRDSFGNIVAEIGSVNGNKSGDYLIRRAGSDASMSSLYNGVVDVPSAYGTMLIRYLLFSNTTEELEAVHAYQNASGLASLPRQETSMPNLTSLAPNGIFLGIDTPSKLLSLAATILPFNHPQRNDQQRVNTILAQAGITNGQYIPQNVSLTIASAITNTTISADISAPSNIRYQSNGWQLYSVDYQAQYGTNYGARAYVAIYGYQQLTVRQALYPEYRALSFNSEVTLEPNTSYLLTFSGKPQLKRSGFWSYTIYAADQYLVPNPLDRFEIGNRSPDLAYQDGSGLVYGPRANASHDGPFQILVQNVNNTPPSNGPVIGYLQLTLFPTSQDGTYLKTRYRMARMCIQRSK